MERGERIGETVRSIAAFTAFPTIVIAALRSATLRRRHYLHHHRLLALVLVLVLLLPIYLLPTCGRPLIQCMSSLLLRPSGYLSGGGSDSVGVKAFESDASVVLHDRRTAQKTN